MALGPPFCPYCGARQIKAGARFCYACGRPIPAAPTRPPAPPKLPPAPRRPVNLWWLLPLLLAIALVAAVLMWEPARSRVADLIADMRQRVAESRATPEPTATDATPTASPNMPVAQADRPSGAGPVEVTTVQTTAPLTAALPLTVTAIPTPTPQPTATPPPTATPSPTSTPQPTATPSPTATPEPTAEPTPTPCSIVVNALFQAIWTQHRPQLGCAVSRAASSYAATQRFQYGRMIWRENNDMIYVLYDDSDWAMYADIYQEGAPEPGVFQPPQGLYVPVRGFGAIWHARLGGAGARIGWAIEPEYAVSVFAQDFERGLMLEMEGTVYLLGDDGGGWWTP